MPHSVFENFQDFLLELRCFFELILAYSEDSNVEKGVPNGDQSEL